jgi:hypothetical protein
MKGPLLLLLVASSVFAVNYSLVAAASSDFWSKRVPLIEGKFAEVTGHIEKDDIKAAKKACDDAYFGIFEESGANMEVAIRSESGALAADLESKFVEIRKMVAKKASPIAISNNIKSLVENLKSAAADLDKDKVAAK